MAKIEMDISEYEAMKENKKMLEDSLNRERELSSKIDKLKEEKIEALKEAEKKVIKYTEVQNIDCILQRRPDKQIISELMHFTRVLEDSGRYSTSSQSNSIINHLEEMFFERTSMRSELETSNLTVHGLDEVKDEIKTQMKKEVQNEVSNLETKVEVMKQTAKSNKEKLENVKTLELTIDKLKDDIEKYKGYEEKYFVETNIIGEIKEELENDSFFTRGQVIKNISKLVK